MERDQDSPNMAHPPWVVVHLEQPLAAFREDGLSVKDVLVVGLTWPTDYWPALAIDWLRQGAPVGGEIAELLMAVSRRQGFGQSVQAQCFCHRETVVKARVALGC